MLSIIAAPSECKQRTTLIMMSSLSLCCKPSPACSVSGSESTTCQLARGSWSGYFNQLKFDDSENLLTREPSAVKYNYFTTRQTEFSVPLTKSSVPRLESNQNINQIKSTQSWKNRWILADCRLHPHTQRVNWLKMLNLQTWSWPEDWITESINGCPVHTKRVSRSLRFFKACHCLWDSGIVSPIYNASLARNRLRQHTEWFQKSVRQWLSLAADTLRLAKSHLTAQQWVQFKMFIGGTANWQIPLLSQNSVAN